MPLDYQAIELQPQQAAGHAQRVRDGQWAGCSVTMPLKDAFVPFMDEVSDRVARLGALNTIVKRPDGTLFGENTDVHGLVQSLRDFGVQHMDQVLILGAGNTALAAVEAAAELGAQEVEFVVRDASRASEALDLAGRLGLAATATAIGQVRPGLPGGRPVISTLPARAADAWVPALGDGSSVLLDVAYDPWPSQLAASWGGEVISGLHMLVHQAVEQVRLFTGLDFDTQRTENVTNAMYQALGLHRRG